MTPATLPPRVRFGAVDEYPHLDPVVTWEEVRPTGALLRCRVDCRIEAQLERARGGSTHNGREDGR